MTTEDIDPRDRFGVRFVGLARAWRRHLDGALTAAGFGGASWVPLIHLDGGGGITQRDLAARCGLDNSSLVRLLDALGDEGLVERRPKPGDRRAKCVHLTEAGRSAVAAIRPVIAAAERRMLEGASAAEVEAALVLFDRIEAGFAGTSNPGEPA